MKGYLQRLAIGVMQPAGSIRPLVGSVFAPPPSPHTQERRLPGESVSNSRSSTYRAVEEENTGARRPHNPPESAYTPESAYPPEPAYMPLMPRSEMAIASNAPPTGRDENLAVTSGTIDTVGRITSQAARGYEGMHGDEERGERREGDASGESQPQEIVVNHVYTPLIGSSPGRLAHTAHPFADRTNARASASRPAAPASREPDEIQIHIGRIEVTAVQQMTAPAAVKQVRRGLSLDEYLRRADGRG